MLIRPLRILIQGAETIVSVPRILMLHTLFAEARTPEMAPGDESHNRFTIDDRHSTTLLTGGELLQSGEARNAICS
jgi:hypothetical protein